MQKMSKRALEIRDEILADAAQRYGSETVAEWADDRVARELINALAQSTAGITERATRTEGTMDKPIKIIIEVSGGVVQGVYSSLTTPGAIVVTVHDHDNIKAGDTAPEGADEYMNPRCAIW